MPRYLKFINELSVNGKPVEDDDEDEDYTAATDDEAEDEPADDGLDLGTGDEPEETPDTTEEDDPDDDYTTPTEDETEDEEPEDDGLDLDAGTPAETDDTGEEEPATDDTGGDEAEPADAGDDVDTGEEPATDDTEGEGDTGGDLDLSTDDSGTGDEGDDDYTADTGEGDDDYTADGEGEIGEEDPDASGDDMGTEEPAEDSLETKIKQTEAEIFSTLSPEEKAIKNRDLIDNYVTLKNVIKIFLEKVRSITLTDDNTSILQFVEVCLVDLGNTISDYIIQRYSKKSYIENFVLYQQIILTVEQLKEIISKLNVDENPKK